MAGYSAVIDLRVNGLDGLRTVSDRIESINRLIKQVKPVPTLFDKRGTDELKAAKKELELLVKAYADGGNRSAAFSTSIAGLNQQLGTFRSIAANAKTGSEQFTNALKAAELASSRLTNAELQRFSTLKDLYTRTATGALSAEDQGPSGLTKSVLDLGKSLPTSIAGLRTYAAELDRIFTLVEAGSADFRALQTEIARVNREIDIATGAGAVQGPALPPSMRGGTGTRGLTSPIGGRADIPGSPAALAAASAARTKMVENLALGAGFPLLFGGGPGQVIGGLLGSFVGTGFGGQILGSALGGQLERLGVAAAEAGAALQKPIDNFNTLEERAILASSSQERYIKNLIDAGQYIEATAAVQKRYNEVIGRQASQDLLRLARNSDELSRTWGELNLQLQAALAGPLAGLLSWINNILRINITQPGEDAARLQSFMGQLSPEQQKEYFRRSIELRNKNKGVVDPAALRRLQEEMLPGGIPGFAATPASTDFKATEGQALASLERRKEVQAQITRLRESEIAASQKQVQNDLTLLNTQKQFALTLNQEAAIIDQIALKKLNAANAEYALTQRQQQALVINAELELKAAEAKAMAASEEMRQLDAANKLTPLRQAELQAIIEGVTVARSNLEITQGIADNVTRSAAAQAQQVAQLTELERRQAQVNAYAAENERINSRIALRLQEQTNALDNQARYWSAISQATQTINNIEIESLTRELERTVASSEREEIIKRIYDLEVKNAQVTLLATRAQIRAEVQRSQITYRRVQQEFQSLRANVAYARSMGIINREQQEALEAQASALRIAFDNLRVTELIAEAQWKAADAVFEAAVKAADLKAEMLRAQQAAVGLAAAGSAAAGAMDRTATAAKSASQSVTMVFREFKPMVIDLESLGVKQEKDEKRQQVFGPAEVRPDRYIVVPPPQFGGSSTINVTTGPVMQQQGQKFVTLEDFERGLQHLADVMLDDFRSAGGRRYQGVN